MAANKIVITTFLLVAVFADAGKRSWDDYYEELRLEEDDGRQTRQPGSEGSSLSLVQVALTDEEQSRRSASENKDAGSKRTSEHAASGALAAAEEAAASVSSAASFVADIASETASKALSNASTRLDSLQSGLPKLQRMRYQKLLSASSTPPIRKLRIWQDPRACIQNRFADMGHLRLTGTVTLGLPIFQLCNQRKDALQYIIFGLLFFGQLCTLSRN